MSAFWDGFTIGFGDQLLKEIEQAEERVNKIVDRAADYQIKDYITKKNKRDEKIELTKGLVKNFKSVFGEDDPQALEKAAYIISKQGIEGAQSTLEIMKERKTYGFDPNAELGYIADPEGSGFKDLDTGQVAERLIPEVSADFTIPDGPTKMGAFDKLFGGDPKNKFEERISMERSAGLIPSGEKKEAPEFKFGSGNIPTGEKTMSGLERAILNTPPGPERDKLIKERSGLRSQLGIGTRSGSDGTIGFSSAMLAHNRVVDTILGNKYLIDGDSVYLRDQGKMISMTPGSPEHEQFLRDKEAANQQATITVRPLVKPSDRPSFDITFPSVGINPEGFDPEDLGVKPVPVGKN